VRTDRRGGGVAGYRLRDGHEPIDPERFIAQVERWLPAPTPPPQSPAGR
jgi:hypothetical protein